MRTLFALLALVLTLQGAFGQNALVFANGGAAVNAPITNAAGQPVNSASGIVADLFYSANTNTAPDPLGSDSLTAAGFNQRFSSLGDGYFLGGAKSLNNVSNTVLFQVRAWDTNYGSSFGQARDAGGEFGYSAVLLLTLTAPPATPALLKGLGGFRLRTLDESSPGSQTQSDQNNGSPPVVAVGGAGTPSAFGAFGLLSGSSGCGPWLEATLGGSPTNAQTSIIVTIHNSKPGRSYELWSQTNLSSTGWVPETNFLGANGQNETQVRVAMGNRTNLFLRTATNASFRGLTGTNYLGGLVADTMGAVGPDHFVEVLNNGVAVFAKTNGAILQKAGIRDFFTIGTNAPPASVTDPRILYDHDQQRWVASIIDFDSHDVILAVSKTNTPLDLVTNWVRYRIGVAQPNRDSDYDTMGMDANGIYLSVVHRTSKAGPKRTQAIQWLR